MFDKIYRYGSIIALISVFILFFLLCLFCFASCTLSVTTLHTQGSASDVVDEGQTISPKTTATVDVPLTK